MTIAIGLYKRKITNNFLCFLYEPAAAIALLKRAHYARLIYKENDKKTTKQDVSNHIKSIIVGTNISAVIKKLNGKIPSDSHWP